MDTGQATTRGSSRVLTHVRVTRVCRVTGVSTLAGKKGQEGPLLPWVPILSAAVLPRILTPKQLPLARRATLGPAALLAPGKAWQPAGGPQRAGRSRPGAPTSGDEGAQPVEVAARRARGQRGAGPRRRRGSHGARLGAGCGSRGRRLPQAASGRHGQRMVPRGAPAAAQGRSSGRPAPSLRSRPRRAMTGAAGPRRGACRSRQRRRRLRDRPPLRHRLPRAAAAGSRPA